MAYGPDLPFVLLAIFVSFLAGISTLVGAVIVLLFKKIGSRTLGFILGFGAGVIVFIGFVELLPIAIASWGQSFAFLGFFIGMGLAWLVDIVIPHRHPDGVVDEGILKVRRSAIVTTIGIAIHNFPEGLIVFFASLRDITFALPIVIAIALHNIPEGMMVAAPVFKGNGSKKQALTWATLSGLAEPLAAMIGALILLPFFNVIPFVLDIAMAFVAGLMVYIGIEELLPTARQQCDGHPVAAGVMIGMLIMALSLILFAI
jgi:ZIP family zinc transporter